MTEQKPKLKIVSGQGSKKFENLKPGEAPTVTIGTPFEDIPFVTEDDLLNPDDGHIVKDLNEIYALVIVGDKAVIINTSKNPLGFLTVPTFELWYSNKFVTLRDKAKKMPV